MRGRDHGREGQHWAGCGGPTDARCAWTVLAATDVRAQRPRAAIGHSGVERDPSKPLTRVVLPGFPGDRSRCERRTPLARTAQWRFLNSPESPSSPERAWSSPMPRTSSRPNPTHRIERVSELVRQAIADVLARGDIPDPTLERQLVTIRAVRMSSDLRLATVSVMPLGGKNGEATIESLNLHKKELRGLVAHRVNLRFAPDLRFTLDSSYDAQARIDALLNSPEVARDLGGPETGSKDRT
jgi:ribosome-binding factor A